MTFGRPTMIYQPSRVPVPELVDDGYLSTDGEGLQPSEIPSRMGLFVSTCGLFEILGDILSSVNIKALGSVTPNDDETVTRLPEMIADALQFNRRLDTFSDSIPDYLQTKDISRTTISEKNTCVHLQQQVLYCR